MQTFLFQNLIICRQRFSVGVWTTRLLRCEKWRQRGSRVPKFLNICSHVVPRTLSGILRLSPRRSVLTLKVRNKSVFSTGKTLILIDSRIDSCACSRIATSLPDKILTIAKPFANDMQPFWVFVLSSIAIHIQWRNGCRIC